MERLGEGPWEAASQMYQARICGEMISGPSVWVLDTTLGYRAAPSSAFLGFPYFAPPPSHQDTEWW